VTDPLPAGRYGPRVRPLTVAHRTASARLHQEILDGEFLARFGPGFLRRYHRAWIDSPGGLALGAFDEEGVLVGVLLGAVDPSAHVAAMVLEHGVGLAGRLLVAAVVRPRLAHELAVTRGTRYASGLWRTMGRPAVRRLACFHRPAIGGGFPSPVEARTGPRSGEVTHLLVVPAQQGRGVGRTLLHAAEELAQQAGLDELVLVTPPDQAARGFYERLGWSPDGALTSRSGEAFVRYRYRLG